jgi:integrase
MRKSKARAKKPPKRLLALPDLEHAKAAVLNSLTSASAQRTYDHAIREFVTWYCSEPRLAFNRTVVLRYRVHLELRGYAPTTINLRLAAVRRIAYEAADADLLSPELAAGIRRVKGMRRIGVRLGNWLTPEQGRRLLESTTRSTIRELRDHAMVAMLLGCGLRRAELLALRLESIQQREEHWVPTGNDAGESREPLAAFGMPEASPDKWESAFTKGQMASAPRGTQAAPRRPPSRGHSAPTNCAGLPSTYGACLDFDAARSAEALTRLGGR